MRSLLVVLSTTLLLLAGCQRDSAAPSSSGNQAGNSAVQNSKVLKIKVTAGGEITADDQPVTLEQLAVKLAELKKAGGVVWYHRANPGGEPHPNAMKVIALVVENKLPIRLSTKPDFSDAVDDKGMSHPDDR
jgi:biopolymer transport protein ExbD